jgi:FkbM family methyltransferase
MAIDVKHRLGWFNSLRMLKRRFAPTLNLPHWMYAVTAPYLDYEPVETEWVRSVVKPGMVCYDLGAHWGYYTCLLSELVGPSGKVYAFEPDPDNRLKLEGRVSGLSNVTVLALAVGDKVGQIHVVHDSVNDAGSKTRPVAEGIPVPMATLDSLQLPRPNFLKADIEGYELHMLRGMSFNPEFLLIELFPDYLWDAGTDPKDLLAEVEKRNYAIERAKWQKHDNLLCTLRPRD